jgi:hypothetical protein
MATERSPGVMGLAVRCKRACCVGHCSRNPGVGSRRPCWIGAWVLGTVRVANTRVQRTNASCRCVSSVPALQSHCVAFRTHATVNHEVSSTRRSTHHACGSTHPGSRPLRACMTPQTGGCEHALSSNITYNQTGVYCLSVPLLQVAAMTG